TRFFRARLNKNQPSVLRQSSEVSIKRFFMFTPLLSQGSTQSDCWRCYEWAGGIPSHTPCALCFAQARVSLRTMWARGEGTPGPLVAARNTQRSTHAPTNAPCWERALYPWVLVGIALGLLSIRFQRHFTAC